MCVPRLEEEPRLCSPGSVWSSEAPLLASPELARRGVHPHPCGTRHSLPASGTLPLCRSPFFRASSRPESPASRSSLPARGTSHQTMALQLRAPLAWAADVSRGPERYSQRRLGLNATDLALAPASQTLRQTTPQRSLTRKPELPRAKASSVSSAGGLQGSRLPDQFLELTSQEELDVVLEEASKNGQLVLVEWCVGSCCRISATVQRPTRLSSGKHMGWLTTSFRLFERL